MAHPARLQPRACEVCDQTDTLTICESCKAVWYCSPHHKDTDRDKHRHACELVATTRREYETEERILRDESSADGRASYFETDVGRFWQIYEARDYLLKRLQHAGTLLHFFGSTDGEGTVTARVDVLEFVLAELLDMLRLSRRDDVGASTFIPAIYLALGRDQEAYDFIKWNTTASSTWYSDDWNDLDKPHVDLQGADVLEDNLDVWLSRSDEMLSYLVAVILIKFRAILCLLEVQKARRLLRGVLPNEIIDVICQHLAGPVLSSRPDILRKDTNKTTYIIYETRHQALKLYIAVVESITPFWDLMLDHEPEAVKRNRKRQLAPKSSEEADLLARYNFTPWLLTPAALEAVRAWREWELRGGFESL